MIEVLTKAIHEGHRQGTRIIFIQHPGFAPDVAKTVITGPVTLVTATPYWWKALGDEIKERAEVVPADVVTGRMRFRGIEVRHFNNLHTDPDWPIILEAVVRLKLLDISAVFR